ncbi:MAG: YcnI family protein [Pseudonocardiaceae bacterium]
MSRMGKSVRMPAVVLGVVGGLLLGAAPAPAHVSVVPDAAPGGSTGVLTFRVPNERENTATVKVEVFLPGRQPIPSVRPAPVPGWHTTVVGKPVDGPSRSAGTAQVTSIVWDGGVIAPGRSTDFAVSMGPLPERGRLVFKTLQTYADGAVARWIEEPAAGGVDPVHPAAVLTLTSGGPGATARSSAGPGAWYVLPGAIALTGLLASAVGLAHRRFRR